MKYHIITFGCQMNKSDSERIAGLFLSLGWQKTVTITEADLIVINTCSVRQAAENRVFGQRDNFLALKKKNPRLRIAVTGCMPGRDKNGVLRKKTPWVDFWFPIKDLPKLPSFLSLRGVPPQTGRRGNPINDKIATVQWSSDLAMTEYKDYFHIKPSYPNKFQAFVPIQTGCNFFCAYCVVPFARGPEQSRPLKEILREIRALAKNGCLEITLLGQTVNNYTAPDPENFSPKNPYKNPPCIPLSKRGNEGDFAALLWEVNQISGLRRINFTAPYPILMTDEVIDALCLPKQMNYLHLPVQSGDNAILKKMNRRYTAQDYLAIVKKIHAKRPDIALGTDIIVGFCGETKKQFENTVKLYKKADFDISYHAMYSQRSGTLAAKKFKDSVTPKEKKRRWMVLQKLMEKTTLRKNQKYVGKTVEVLVEKRKDGFCLGNSREMKLVRFKIPHNSPISPFQKGGLRGIFKGEAGGFVGKIVKIKITQAKTWVLEGVPLSDKPPHHAS
ncbi:MAG: tRNA (N6-isopentenyl adenosine(37)-C2)-methylthiotransferase MiaB [bacterium]|nr:tRNA (N6-isopentenyl adenosine(37)-C2)-methylthiotransferase MiaB [bacterium]